MTQAFPILASLVVAAYLAGSIPASHWTALVFYGKDLRTLGSGNLGATNVQRNLDWGAAIPVGLFDVLKGFVPAFWFPQLDGSEAASWGVVYGAAAILGHSFSLWVRFRGGKGVATGAGVLLAVAPLAAVVGIVSWIVVLLAARKVSVASMAAALSVPLAAVALPRLAAGSVDPPQGPLLVFLTGMAAFVIWTHRSNIRRLRTGREPSVGGRDGGEG